MHAVLLASALTTPGHLHVHIPRLELVEHLREPPVSGFRAFGARDPPKIVVALIRRTLIVRFPQAPLQQCRTNVGWHRVSRPTRRCLSVSADHEFTRRTSFRGAGCNICTAIVLPYRAKQTLIRTRAPPRASSCSGTLESCRALPSLSAARHTAGSRLSAPTRGTSLAVAARATSARR